MEGTDPMIRPFDLAADAEMVLSWLASRQDIEFWNGRVPERGLTPATLREWHEDPDTRAFVLADPADKPVAYGEIWFDPSDRSAELAHLLVAPDHRGKGFGKMLTLALVAAAGHRSGYEVLLRVVPSNKSAIRCYESCGFQHASPERSRELNAGEQQEYLWMTLPVWSLSG